jgi:hypothetical protein
MFAASVTIEIGDGASTRFWTDNWLPAGTIHFIFPNLYKAVGRRRLGHLVRTAMTDYQWVRDITGARTAPVLIEYVQLWMMLRDVQLRPLESDRFVWRWTADGQYSVRSAYRAYFEGWTKLAGAKELWRAAVPPKVKFFFWLALHRRLWIADRWRRHGLQPAATCVLCDQADETTDHLLCSCVFSREVWARLLLPIGLDTLTPCQNSSLIGWWLPARVALPRTFRKSFDSLVLLVSWCIWKERNARTFDHRAATSAILAQRIITEADELIGSDFSSIGLLTALANSAICYLVSTTARFRQLGGDLCHVCPP